MEVSRSRSHLAEIIADGYTVIPHLVDSELISSLAAGMNEAYKECRSIQIKNGIAANTDGTVHHLLSFEGPFLDFIGHLYCHELLTEFFGGPYILNTFGGVNNLPGSASYVAGIHRDIRGFYGCRMMINMLVMVDNFSSDNGGTFILPRSHLKGDRPEDNYFYDNAVQITGQAGTVLLFDSYIWHAGGVNRTDMGRRALTLAFTRPFYKPQLDYPRLLGYERAEDFGEDLKQVLGYNARVPTSLVEWYQPPQSRFYKPGQG